MMKKPDPNQPTRATVSVLVQPPVLRQAIRDYLFPILLGCLFFSAAECAEEAGGYLVIGSYEKEQQAIAEGERFSRAVGVEILLLPVEVSGRSYYRLLVHLFTDEYDQIRLKNQLRYAGVGDMWPINITGKEPGLRSMFTVIDYDDVVPISPQVFTEPVSVVKKNFLVTGSFRDMAKAQSLQQKLSGSFEQVLVKTARVNGVDFHRVLVGPVEVSAEEETMIRTREAGVPNAWLLRDVPIEMLDSRGVATIGSDLPAYEVGIRQPAEIARDPATATSQKTSRTQTKLEDTPAEAGSYNPAKLRTTPSPFFLGEKHQRE